MRARHGLNTTREAGSKIVRAPRGAQRVPHNCLHAGQSVLDTMIEFAEQQILHLTRVHLRRDVAEVADDPEPSVRQQDTIDPPLVIFFCPAIPTLLRTFRSDVRVAGCQRVAKDAHHLVGVLLVPEDMHDLVEVPPDDPARNVSKRGKCGGVDDANFEIRIHRRDRCEF
jgi:hypothetical protein